MKRISRGIAACMVLLIVAGCVATPADYVASLSPQDPKWQSPECQQIRATALGYEAREQKVYWSAGLLLGPYGLGLVAAGKEHQAKQKKELDREIHLRCSSQPLPKNLAPPR
ncbi:MAG: hypothetical protein M9924_15250 [Rhizobiaceae bacterium]|nr:hypothetical protein [Rhizobiaceae bacterium]